MLTTAQSREYSERGFLQVSSLFLPEETSSWLAEYERLLNLPLVSPENLRTPFSIGSQVPERFDPVIDIAPIFERLVNDERIIGLARAALGDTPILFKDKLITKPPGAFGYRMHQDYAWWQNVQCPADSIVSISIAIDTADQENGAIELSSGYHHQLLTPVGELRNFNPDDATKIADDRRQLVTSAPGDVLIFHSLCPHTSGNNLSTRFRRSIYLTYSGARYGSLRAEYYDQQMARIAERSPGVFFA